MIYERAYAKINLALEVMDSVDGYHMVNNLMVGISLYDELEFCKASSIYVEDDFLVDNICIKACKLFFNHFKIDGGVCIKIKKNIPIAAGLAGGSSDAASCLRGLNRLYNVNASNSELKEIAKLLGSDVAFFIDNQLALCTNRGEVINHIDVEPFPMNVLLIKPMASLSTKLVYQNYVYDRISKKDKIDNIIKGLKNKDISLIKKNIFNDLANTSLKLCQDLNDTFNILVSNGYKPLVSGSGPTLFLLDASIADEQAIKKLLGSNHFIYLAKTI